VPTEHRILETYPLQAAAAHLLIRIDRCSRPSSVRQSGVVQRRRQPHDVPESARFAFATADGRSVPSHSQPRRVLRPVGERSARRRRLPAAAELQATWSGRDEASVSRLADEVPAFRNEVFVICPPQAAS
jgi:hypothetical protein